MADYFLLLDAVTFETQARPALAASWQQRSFTPCLALCRDLIPSAHNYTERYHTGGEEPLLSQIASGHTALQFHREFWRALVSEVLLYSALEIPEFQIMEETLSALLSPGQPQGDAIERASYTPIQQVHFGTRDLTFGSAVYRPNHAGYNNVADVKRLTEYLEGINPQSWSVADLGESIEEDEKLEELEDAREWFPSLRGMYQLARAAGWIVVHERIY